MDLEAYLGCKFPFLSRVILCEKKSQQMNKEEYRTFCQFEQLQPFQSVSIAAVLLSVLKQAVMPLKKVKVKPS